MIPLDCAWGPGLRSLIQACWDSDPTKRPDFHAILRSLSLLRNTEADSNYESHIYGYPDSDLTSDEDDDEHEDSPIPRHQSSEGYGIKVIPRHGDAGKSESESERDCSEEEPEPEPKPKPQPQESPLENRMIKNPIQRTVTDEPESSIFDMHSPTPPPDHDAREGSLSEEESLLAATGATGATGTSRQTQPQQQQYQHGSPQTKHNSCPPPQHQQQHQPRYHSPPVATGATAIHHSHVDQQNQMPSSSSTSSSSKLQSVINRCPQPPPAPLQQASVFQGRVRGRNLYVVKQASPQPSPSSEHQLSHHHTSKILLKNSQINPEEEVLMLEELRQQENEGDDEDCKDEIEHISTSSLSPRLKKIHRVINDPENPHTLESLDKKSIPTFSSSSSPKPFSISKYQHKHPSPPPPPLRHPHEHDDHPLKNSLISPSVATTNNEQQKYHNHKQSEENETQFLRKERKEQAKVEKETLSKCLPSLPALPGQAMDIDIEKDECKHNPSVATLPPSIPPLKPKPLGLLSQRQLSPIYNPNAASLLQASSPASVHSSYSSPVSTSSSPSLSNGLDYKLSRSSSPCSASSASSLSSEKYTSRWMRTWNWLQNLSSAHEEKEEKRDDMSKGSSSSVIAQSNGSEEAMRHYDMNQNLSYNNNEHDLHEAEEIPSLSSRERSCIIL